MTPRKNSFKTTGDFFKNFRLEQGLSQSELAKRLGFSSPQIVSNWERGECAPPLKSMVQMCEMFNISKAEVVELLLNENKKFLETQFFKKNKRAIR